MGAHRKTQGVRPLLERADRLPRRCNAEWGIGHAVRHVGGRGCVHESEIAFPDIDKLSADARKAGPHLFGRIDEVVLSFAVPTASLIQRRSSLPGVALESETEFIQHSRR